MKISPLLALAPLLVVANTGRARAQEPVEPPLRLRADGAFDGYTLYSPLNSSTVYLVDMDGKVAHEWKTNYAPGEFAYFLDNGNLLRCGRVDDNPRFHGGGIGGAIQEIEWDGKVVWEYTLATDRRTLHHDIACLPNGNVLAIAWEHCPREDAVALGRDPAKTGNDGFWPDAVLEIKPVRPTGGEIVWEWHAWDHLIQDFDEQAANYGSVAEHPELFDVNFDHRDRAPLTEAERKKKAELERQMRALGYAGGDDPNDATSDDHTPVNPDWMHTNAIHYEPALDLIVLCSPHLGEIFVIDHSTTTAQAARHAGGRYGKGGDLLYRWGNPRNYGAGDAADRQLFYQHDAQWLAGAKPGEWRILLFNNGQERPTSEFSSVDEIVLPFDVKTGFARAPGKAFEPASPAWTYKDPGTFYSPFISGAQRLKNGNTLVCSGVEARIFEVTRDGRVVWDYRNPHGGEVPATDQSGKAPPKALFRATRIAKDHPALKAHNL